MAMVGPLWDDGEKGWMTGVTRLDVHGVLTSDVGVGGVKVDRLGRGGWLKMAGRVEVVTGRVELEAGRVEVVAVTVPAGRVEVVAVTVPAGRVEVMASRVEVVVAGMTSCEDMVGREVGGGWVGKR